MILNDMQEKNLKALEDNRLIHACTCLFSDLFDRAEKAEKKVNGMAPITIDISGSTVIEGTLDELFEIIRAVHCLQCTEECGHCR